MRAPLLPLTILCLLLVLAGCGPRLAHVTGNVTIDGAPVDSGTISFVPGDSQASPATTEIKGGKYEVKVPLGKHKVQISAPSPKRQMPEHAGPNARMIDVDGGERLPPQFNTATTLEYEAKGGSETKDWATTTK